MNSRYYNNTEKLNNVFANHDVDFTSTTDVYNVITKKVLPKDQADIFLAHDEAGSELFNLVRAERLYGEKSIWDPMVKRKLPTFAQTTKKVNVKVNNKVVQLKEEKTLMTKFILASRKQKYIDLPYIILVHMNFGNTTLIIPTGWHNVTRHR